MTLKSLLSSLLLGFLLATASLPAASIQVQVGSERLFSAPFHSLLAGKRIGLITNQTAIDSKGKSTLSLLKEGQTTYGYTLTALFAPEHGLYGHLAAGEAVSDTTDDGIPVYSLHGDNRRPTAAMLATIDLLIYDIQDIGSRSYTYATTLYYAMEEAASHEVSVVVLDRPNPINGITIDGPVLEKEWRSFVGYLSIPYCHGMTIGELALFFNGEYAVGCDLHVVPMEGWRRSMTFGDTGLLWIPTSPYIPEPTTPLYYPMTGILGELQMTSIGIGYPLPFKVVGAPWIDADKFAKALNSQKFPGIVFLPFHFRPHSGRHCNELCHGVLLQVTNTTTYLPVSTQYLIIGLLKTLYPLEFNRLLKASTAQMPMFNRINGTKAVSALLEGNKPVVWALRALHQKERESFRSKRERYLLKEYSESWHSLSSAAKN